MSAAWLSVPEKGTLLGMRVLIALCGLAGRRATRLVLRLVVLYYVVVHADVRRASRRWLRRVHGRAGGLGPVYRHVLRFAQVALDRVFLLTGRTDLFTFTHVGREHLAALRARGQGALLVGAHLGSFEAMRVLARDNGFRVHVLAHEANARLVNALLRRLDPSGAVTLIEVGPDAAPAVFQVQELIERGELVALLGDRTGLSSRAAVVDFMGAPAALPTGPFALAAALGCPVHLTFALYRDPDRYELICEPFAERLDLPRQGRDEALREVVARFAARLEHHARRAPDNWFNFYDFWALAPRSPA
ncbi:MAG: lipid A biosynthesis acyltransferase [Planctomycetes bacterium]|nr:lipid A biosynthesis acyltransferase [Planctomycetota bacterium]